MSTTLIRAYESFFSLIDVEGTTEGRSLAVSLNKSYAQVFYAKADSSEPRLFFMANVPETNNLVVKIFTVNVSGSGSTANYTPNVELVSFSGEFNYLNPPDNEAEPFSNARWYYVDTEINLTQGNYYAIVFSSDESVEADSPKIYFTKKYRNEIFPIFLGKTSTQDWSNELIPTSSSGSLRTGSFVVGFTGQEVNNSTNFDSGSVSVGGTGASSRRGYATYLYVQKETSITNDVAVQFFQEPPSDSSDGTSEETDQSMMRFYYFKEGTLPLSGKAFFNKTSNASPTLDENANFILFTQPDRLPPIPKPYLPDSYMQTDYKPVGITSIYDGYEEDKHRIEYERGIIEDTSNRSSLEYWAHFAEMRSADVDGSGNRLPNTSSNPSYIDFSLEQKGNEVEILDTLDIPSTNEKNAFIRGYTNITRVGNYYIGFPKYQTHTSHWYSTVPKYTGSTPKISIQGIISHIKTPDEWSFVDIEIISDYDPYDGGNSDERGGVLGNPNTANTNRYIGVHDTFVTNTSLGNNLFVLLQMFPRHSDAPFEAGRIIPSRSFCYPAVSFTDFTVDSAPSTITFKVIEVENSDPYDGRFEARKIDAADHPFVTTSFLSTANNARQFPNIDADYKAAKFIPNSVSSSGRVYFTILNARHDSEIFRGDERYLPTDMISKFGVWYINSSSLQNNDFDSNNVKANHLRTSEYTRTLHANTDDWATSTSYSIGDVVKIGGNLYKAATNHTAGTFETDYANGEWTWLGQVGYLSNRGFDPLLEHEQEISFILNKFNKIYFGTTTALTGTTPPNSTTATTMAWDTSRTYQIGDYVYDSSSGETYRCVQDHVGITFSVDASNGYWEAPYGTGITDTEYRPNMGEIYKTNNLLSFEEVVDGKLDQDWLVGYTERSIDLTTKGGADNSFVNNDRVVFLAEVNNIVHAWLSPSSDYGSTSDWGTPFHIAHDITFGRTRVLRKFPIWYTYEEEDFFDLSQSGAVAWANQDYTKGQCVFESGTYYTAARNIKSGSDPATFNAQLSLELWRSQWLPDFIKDDEWFTGSFRITKFTEGEIVGDNIYLAGVWAEDHDDYTNNYPKFKHGIRWIQYDTRTINDAYYEYDDVTYKIDPQAADFSTIDTKPVLQWDSGDHSLVVAPHKLMEFLGSKWGVYHHKTISRYEYFESSTMIRDYPALNVGENNPRIGKYCAMVSGANKGLGSLSPQPLGTIENDLSNKDPRLVSQGGICYLICSNIDRGAQVYKTYGFKQNPKDWGLTRVVSGSFSNSTYANLDDNGNRLGRYTYNFDIDKPSYERSLPGFSTFEEFGTYVVNVSKTDRTIFFSTLKDEREKGLDGIYVNAIEEAEPSRTIARLTTGIRLPQNISFFYNLRETAFEPVEIKDEEDLADGEINLPNLLVDPTQTKLTLKHAETLEELFTDPEKIEIPLAQERIVSSTLFDKIMFYTKSLPTDIQSNFFRLESTKLIQDNEFPTAAYDYVTYSGGEKTVKDPFAEVIVKGLRFTDVDFSGAIEGNSLPDKDIVITGISHRSQRSSNVITNPEDILSDNTNSGVYLAPSGFITVVFPKPIYISRIGFNAYYDGADSTSGDLSVFNFSAIPILEKQVYNKNLFSDKDWVSLGSLTFDANRDEDIALTGLSLYTKAIKIELNSGLILRLNNLAFKTFIEDSETTFTTSGSVFNPELIIIDDLRGIIEGTTNANTSTAYTSFRGQNSSLTMDLGQEIPLNRISVNVINAETTRTVRVEVADDSGIFETIFTGNILNYEYSLVRWIPRSKDSSRTVDVRILDSEEANSEFLAGEGFNSDLINFIINNHSSNFSTNFNQNQLSRYSFRPNAFGDKTLTIFGSSSETNVNDYDGSIVVNTQMDEDGYFSNDISMGLGLIERPLNVDFPLKNVRKLRLTILNSGTNIVRMNGLKIYTPLVDSDGLHVSPKAQVNWNIRLSSFVV